MTAPPRRRNVREIETLEALLAQGRDLRGFAIQNLDLTGLTGNWEDLDVDGTLFLGCTFPPGADEALERGGAVLFPSFCAATVRALSSVPVQRDRAQRENRVERAPSEPRPAHLRLVRRGREVRSRRRGGLAQRVHDLSIDDALGDVIGETVQERLDRRIVGIMGGHGAERTSEAYRLAAQTALLLAEDHLVVTGGGPGIMEAGNLGAFMSRHGAGALDDALGLLAKAGNTKHPEYDARAREVRERYRDGTPNLSIPTWFYGFEPSNRFATSIARYFANSIRQDGLLAISLAGIVFADGSAGTVQEIFMDAAQNYYATFDYVSPMALLGKSRWCPTIYPSLKREAKGYGDMLKISDSPEEVAQFIRDTSTTTEDLTTKRGSRHGPAQTSARRARPRTTRPRRAR